MSPPVQRFEGEVLASSTDISTGKGWSKIPRSAVSRRTINPIRDVLSRPIPAQALPESTEPMLSLSIGDPTVFGNLKTHLEVVKAMDKALHSFKANGYPPATGYIKAREAVAKRYSTPGCPLSAKDVVLTNGVSGAVEMAVGVLCNEGQNILLPRPGFGLYNTIATSKNIEVRNYNLLPERNWEVDLEHLESLINSSTAAILINNILAICERHRVPLISDEIYSDMIFAGQTFHPAASLTNTIPILTLSGLAKQWLIPGWRMGWIIVQDHGTGLLDDIRTGLNALATVLNGPNSLVEAAIPEIFDNVPDEFYRATTRILQENAEVAASRLSAVPALKPIIPQGAMYMMVMIDIDQLQDINDDVDFYQRLKWEEHVEVLPGQCFGMLNYIRIVITPPRDILCCAIDRMASFCKRHSK